VYILPHKKNILYPFKGGVVKKLLMSQHFSKIGEGFVLFCLRNTLLGQRQLKINASRA